MCQHDYKILLFHSLSGQTPFWIRGIGTFPGGPVGLFLTKTSPWRISNCNRMDRPVSTPIDSLQVIDISGIVAFDSAWTTPWNLFLQNLVERRSLLFQLVRRDFEQRFVGSAVGWIWGLIQP